MKKYYPYLLILICISSLSCEKIVSIKTPDFKAQLVINGFLSPQDKISVMITRTVPLLDIVPSDLSVENAAVSVFENGSFLETLSYTQEGVYQAISQPKTSHSYHFEVKATGFDDLTTVPEKIPDPVDIQSYTFENDAIAAINGGMTAGIFTWNFERKSSDLTYYGIEITPFRPGNEASSSLDRLLDFEEEFGNICGLITGRINHVIPSTCLDGTEMETLRISIETTFSTSDGPTSFDFLEIKLYNISPSYYAYLKSIRQPDGIESAFINPNILFTNAIGGYGVVGSFSSSSVFRIEL